MIRYNAPGFQAQAVRIARTRGALDGRVFIKLREENLRRAAAVRS